MTPLTLLSKLAQHLPAFEVTTDQHNRRYLTHISGSGATIIVRGNGYNWAQSKRLEISGGYPSHNGNSFAPYPYNERPHISCAISRGAEAIAKDITRRFLPKYLPEYDEALRAMIRAKTRDLDRASILEELAEVLGQEVYQRDGRNPSIRLYNSLSNIGGSISATCDSVHFDNLHVPVAKALQIARVLAS